MRSLSLLVALVACSSPMPSSFPEPLHNTAVGRSVRPGWVVADTSWRPGEPVVYTVCLWLNRRTWCGEMKPAP